MAQKKGLGALPGLPNLNQKESPHLTKLADAPKLSLAPTSGQSSNLKPGIDFGHPSLARPKTQQLSSIQSSNQVPTTSFSDRLKTFKATPMEKPPDIDTRKPAPKALNKFSSTLSERTSVLEYLSRPSCVLLPRSFFRQTAETSHEQVDKLFKLVNSGDQLLSHLTALEMLSMQFEDLDALFNAVKSSVNSRFALLSFIHNPSFSVLP